MEHDMTQPLVTIFFLTYNRPHLFPEALYSIQNQTFPNFRVIVLDNGSTPPITLPECIASDPRFNLIRNDDNANGRAIYLDLIRSIETKYTAYLFDDDRWAPDKLARQVAFLESSPDTIACFSHAKLVDEFGRHLVEAEANNPFSVPNRTRSEWVRQFFFRGNCLCQASALVRAKVLATAHPLSPYFQLPDFAIWVALLAHGDLYIIQEPLTIFNWATDGSNESAINTPAKSNRLNFDYSRIYHQFLNLPHDVLCDAFELPHISSQDAVTAAIFQGAVNCGDEAHFRFGAELAEARFKHHYLNGDHASAAYWERYAKIGASQTQGISAKESVPMDKHYQTWLTKRELVRADRQFSCSQEGETQPFLHIIVRISPGEEFLLANTLDSLGGQFYPNWHLEIITELAPPEGLNDIPCIGWHTTKTEIQKDTIDTLVNLREFDWCIDIPAGARLDPFYLWRLSSQVKIDPTISCLFVDDDCFNESGERFSPRFKPGVNQAALQSADLAGPICIRRDLWQATGGASPRIGSPWFEKMLKVADISGWNSIKHIPDVLISYPEKFPNHFESCLTSLIENFKGKNIDVDIVPVNSRSWNIRYPLSTAPTVSIAIISQCQLDLLSRCFDSIITKTNYPHFEIIVASTDADQDPELSAWLLQSQQKTSIPIRIAKTSLPGNTAALCNTGVHASTNDMVLLIDEAAVVIQKNWLEELVRTCLQPDVAATSPRLIAPGSGLAKNAGNVLGLEGVVGSPYQNGIKLGTPGYLDILLLARDVSALPSGCMLVRKTAYLAVGGMDETELGSHFIHADFCQKLAMHNLRSIYQPLATVVHGDIDGLPAYYSAEQKANFVADQARATTTFYQRWHKSVAVNRFWNPNLSLANSTPSPEVGYRPIWQYLPSEAPRILARTLTNGQGAIRLSTPLQALRKAGLAAECIWPQKGTREPSVAEILRLAPKTMIVQNYLNDIQLPGLQAWHSLPNRPFMVYALDDLITDMAASNQMRKNIPADSRARVKYALARCDRMVVSTDFLAETYRHFIPDIRVVPNLLEQEVWLPLSSKKRTSSKARIGWAGGTTHQGDLLLLKEIIEETRDEAEWVFFGMCPDEIRPLIAEYHPFAAFSEYPARLASLNLDIAVAPLAQIPFNQGKSNLRLLEYGALGIPVVCSDIDPYQNSPACCLPNKPKAWIEALRARIHDADTREQEGIAMRKWVQQHFLLENNLETWLAAHLPD